MKPRQTSRLAGLLRFLIVQLSLNVVPLFGSRGVAETQAFNEGPAPHGAGNIRPRNLSDSRLTSCGGRRICFGHCAGEFFMLGVHDQRRGAVREPPAVKGGTFYQPPRLMSSASEASSFSAIKCRAKLEMTSAPATANKAMNAASNPKNAATGTAMPKACVLNLRMS